MNGADRDFFRKIKVAAFANPFGSDRETIDLELSGLAKSSSNHQIIAKLMAEVLQRIEKYRGGNGKEKWNVSNDDHGLIRFGILFYIFHLFCDSYDALIDRQIKEGEEPCKVAFAKDALQLFAESGFSHREAQHFFSLFFQLRRGFYFINAISGKSQCVKNLRQSLWKNIFTYDAGLYDRHLWNRMEDFSTILLGETGTGKGMAAAAIGRSGFIPFNEKTGCYNESFAGTFIATNLSQFSEHLIESELFGHKKGSFTGAVENHQGILSRCSPHGAIFLDEIGEVSIPVQIKLLQVLQERVFTPVGSHKMEKFEGRVIAATNKSLIELRRQGRFRDDFYYRLCSDTIELPPLRLRLAEHPGELVEILSRTLSRILGYSSEELTEELRRLIVQAMPSDYSWPGNIRELEQCVRQMLLNRSYNWHQSTDAAQERAEFQLRYSQGQFTAAQLLSGYCSHLYDRFGTIEKVAAQVKLDRRTVKKYIDTAEITKDRR
jgi:hypothetical protein